MKFQFLNLPCPGLRTQTDLDLQPLPSAPHFPQSFITINYPVGSQVYPFVTVLCWGLAPRWREIPLV